MFHKIIYFEASDHPGVFECAHRKYFLNLFLNMEIIEDVGKFLGFNVWFFSIQFFQRNHKLPLSYKIQVY